MSEERDSEERKKVLNLLKKAISDELEREEIDKFVTDMTESKNKKINEAVHAIMHFVTDADIRSYDKEYDELCRDKLREYINYLQLW
jgi:hypothetical protein